VRYVIGRKNSLPRLSPAALRTAEGGAEFCDLVESEDIVKDIESLKKLGYTVYSTAVKPGAISAFESRFDPRSVIVLGAEVSGVSPEVQALADRTIHIPGAGAVESLNVAAAAAILCAEAVRISPRTKLVRQGK
jgi:TrmH RNA methyltransferase